MTIYLGADHRGFELKNQLFAWLKEQKYDVVDCGNDHLEPEDDYPDFARAVVQEMKKQGENVPDTIRGILICGSGIGVCISANRFKGIRCGMAINEEHARHGRENDHINILGLAANIVSFEDAQKIITAFLTSSPRMEEKYIRRAKKHDLI